MSAKRDGSRFMYQLYGYAEVETKGVAHKRHPKAENINGNGSEFAKQTGTKLRILNNTFGCAP